MFFLNVSTFGLHTETARCFFLHFLPFAQLADPGFGHAFPRELGPETQTSWGESRVFMHRRCRELAKGRLCEDLFRVHYVDLIWLTFWCRYQTHSLFNGSLEFCRMTSCWCVVGNVGTGASSSPFIPMTWHRVTMLPWRLRVDPSPTDDDF